MQTEIKIFPDIDELAYYFAKNLAEGVAEIPEGEFYTIALSGGSTPANVFQFVETHFRDKIEWRKVLVFWSDERCVDPSSIESNYRMARENLLDHVPIPAANIFRVHGEDSPEVEAVRYAETINNHVSSYQNIPCFDLIMLGMGEDGHTVSIFPGQLQLFGSNNLCAVAQHPVTKQQRITVTGKIINQARRVVFLVTGESKAEMVAQVIEKKEGWEKLPASLVHPANGKLIWLLDGKAAMKLRSTV